MTIGWRNSETLAARQARFEDLLTAHRGIVFKVAHAYAADAEDRRDLAQEIAAQVWRAFPRYDDTRPFPTWLYRVALNVALTFRRNAGYRARHVESVDPDALGALATAPAADDRLGDLWAAIARLDDVDRALVMLYLDGYDHRETGTILGLSSGNVATRLSRLKARLRQEGTHGAR